MPSVAPPQGWALVGGEGGWVGGGGVGGGGGVLSPYYPLTLITGFEMMLHFAQPLF